MEIADSKEFLIKSATSLAWNDLAGKTIMDIGCGEGGNSTLRLAELYPNATKIIATDNDPSAIEVAKYENNHPKVEYHIVDIENWSSVSQWESQIHTIVSHYCFNCVKDAMKAFENVYKLLVPGGTAALLFMLSSNFYDWTKEMGEKYPEYAEVIVTEPPESHTRNYGALHYEQIAKDVGFEIIDCKDEHHCQTFRSDFECKRYLKEICPIMSKLRGSEGDSFRETSFQMFLKYSTTNEHGQKCNKLRIAKILLRKSNKN